MELKSYLIWGLLILAAVGVIMALMRFYDKTPPKDKDYWPGDFERSKWGNRL